jgi:hypothetical protein
MLGSDRCLSLTAGTEPSPRIEPAPSLQSDRTSPAACCRVVAGKGLGSVVALVRHWSRG